MFNTLGRGEAARVSLWCGLGSTHHIPAFHNYSFIFLNADHEKCTDEGPENYIFDQETRSRLSTRLWRIYRGNGACAPAWAASGVGGWAADVSTLLLLRSEEQRPLRVLGPLELERRQLEWLLPGESWESSHENQKTSTLEKTGGKCDDPQSTSTVSWCAWGCSPWRSQTPRPPSSLPTHPSSETQTHGKLP